MNLSKDTLLQWEALNYIGSDGILTGCDDKQEWMLKWWWDHYSQNNSLPVTFFDFGMTKSARLWCEKRGCVVSIVLPKNIVASKEEVEKDRGEMWESVYSGDVWQSRLGWFSKPFALLKSPYDRSCWIDLDCQIMRPLNELIAASDLGTGVAIVREVERSVLFCKKFGIYLEGEVSYNTGVISFKRGSPIILKWAENTLYRTKEFLGDQDVFNRTIFEEKFSLHELPSHFNARPLDGIFPETTILHFTCEPGKNYIFSQIKTC